MEHLDKNFEKQVVWDGKRAEIDKIADGLGKGIDEGIKDAVTAFSVYDFPTSQSCEGHATGDEHGLPYPWVEISVPEPEGRKDSKEKQKERRAENLRHQDRMIGLLTEFYQGRKSDFGVQLTLRNFGKGFVVQSTRAATTELFSPAEQEQRQELYRKEINDFAGFLKDKYFSGQ